MNLSDPIHELPLVGPVYQKRLRKLAIKKIRDLLYHVPRRYEDYRLISNFSRLTPGETVTVHGEIVFARNQYTKSNKKIQIVEIGNEKGNKIQAVWFNQPFLIKNFRKGEMFSFSGKADWFGRNMALIAPEYEKIVADKKLIHTSRIVPVYSTTAGISSKWLRRRVMDILEREPEAGEYLQNDLRKELKLMELADSLKLIHFPETTDDALRGRERLAFDELLGLLILNQLRASEWRKIAQSKQIMMNEKVLREFTEALPFELTKSQKRAISEILTDMNKDLAMNRLLQGDVGSGKTVVAAAAAVVAHANGYKTILMAPTQILANQHYTTLSEFLGRMGMKITLMTGSKKIIADEASVIVGTHALLHTPKNFEDVALMIVDEQHRFGVEQRALLEELTTNNAKVPHVLTMTATPIPRSVALTFYGDLDISALREMPKGRQKITTWVVPPEKRDSGYEWMEKQINEFGTQAFVVCPLIDESEAQTLSEAKAVTVEYERLKKVLPKLKFGLLHGKMKAKEKDAIIDDFRKKKIDVLVATPVVEVGVDIPNATIMIIEATERFGLAQLHQLRGRVGRGEKKSYCMLLTETKSEKVAQRLQVLKQTKCGFELSEMDLQMRGPGEIFGHRQHGIPELKIANWQDVELIKKAKQFSVTVINNPIKYQKVVKHFTKKRVAAN